MVKTKGSLFSLEAHGSISDTLTYSKKRTGQQARKYNKPLVTPTAAQRGQRRLTEFLVAQWQNMSAGDKATWETNAKASNLKLSGYHFFLRSAQRDLYTHHGLCGYWPFNRIVNNKVLDISGNGLHATLKPTPPADAPHLATGMNTRFNNCLLFDATDDYAECDLSSILDLTTNFSLCAWVNQTVLANANKGIIGKYYTGGKFCYGIISGYQNSWFMEISIGGVTYESAPRINIGTGWHWLVATYDGETLLFYVDAVQRASNSDPSGSVQVAANNKLQLGQALYRGVMPGYADEISIYNRLLSLAEIATRYKFATTKI